MDVAGCYVVIKDAAAAITLLSFFFLQPKNVISLSECSHVLCKLSMLSKILINIFYCNIFFMETGHRMCLGGELPLPRLFALLYKFESLETL